MYRFVVVPQADSASKLPWNLGKFGYSPKLIVSQGLPIGRDGANCKVDNP